MRLLDQAAPERAQPELSHRSVVHDHGGHVHGVHLVLYTQSDPLCCCVIPITIFCFLGQNTFSIKLREIDSVKTLMALRAHIGQQVCLLHVTLRTIHTHIQPLGNP
jgi:hypothetical protein